LGMKNTRIYRKVHTEILNWYTTLVFSLFFHSLNIP
jgi:hypothetical protein